MNRTNWITAAVIIILGLLIFQVGVGLGGGRWTTGWGMMGGWGYGLLGGFGMLFMWIVPIGFVALTVAGIVWLGRALGGGGNPAATCPSCGRGVQAGWQHCAHCGADL